MGSFPSFADPPPPPHSLWETCFLDFFYCIFGVYKPWSGFEEKKIKKFLSKMTQNSWNFSKYRGKWPRPYQQSKNILCVYCMFHGVLIIFNFILKKKVSQKWVRTPPLFLRNFPSFFFHETVPTKFWGNSLKISDLLF